MRPLTGHPHPRSGRHARSPSDSALHAALPLSSQPPRPHAVPPRSPAAQLVRDPCGLTGARGTCGQLPILPAASSAAVHVGEVGLASVHVVRAVRRGGSSSLPQALELAANLWVLCRSPVREVNIVGERILKPDSSPPAWNARRTTVGAVVLCVCGVPLGREGESGIAAGGTASLPGGGGIAAGTEASLPSGIAAGEGVRAAD